MTWYSDLLSKGSIFSTTSCTTASPTLRNSAPRMPASSSQRFAALSRKGDSRRVKNAGSLAASPPGAAWPSLPWPWACDFISRAASHGVTENAIASEIAIPRLELIGIGPMYGPISPETKAIGSSAAITVKVARMVGPPTSSTAAGMISSSGLCGSSCWWRWMFSTTTIASSTRMPIEKISANSETRLSVKPQAHEANSVAVSVRITAAPTMTASRRPSAKPTSRITEPVANASFWISLSAFSAAVRP